MKIRILAGIVSSLVINVSTHATVISQWTFETSPPADLSNAATLSNLDADTGSGKAAGVHASAATDWTTPAGNGSANSLSANNWAQNDYWQFQFATTGFDSLQVSWDQRSSSSGPRDFGFFYSADGATFTQFGATFTLGTAFASLTKDLSALLSLNNEPSVFIRLVAMSDTSVGGATIGTSGTSAIDNFIMSGTEIPASVPETGATSLLLALPLLGFWVARQSATSKLGVRR